MHQASRMASLKNKILTAPPPSTISSKPKNKYFRARHLSQGAASAQTSALRAAIASEGSSLASPATSQSKAKTPKLSPTSSRYKEKL